MSEPPKFLPSQAAQVSRAVEAYERKFRAALDNDTTWVLKWRELWNAFPNLMDALSGCNLPGIFLVNKLGPVIEKHRKQNAVPDRNTIREIVDDFDLSFFDYPAVQHPLNSDVNQQATTQKKQKSKAMDNGQVEDKIDVVIKKKGQAQTRNTRGRKDQQTAPAKEIVDSLEQTGEDKGGKGGQSKATRRAGVIQTRALTGRAANVRTHAHDTKHGKDAARSQAHSQFRLRSPDAASDAAGSEKQFHPLPDPQIAADPSCKQCSEAGRTCLLDPGAKYRRACWWCSKKKSKCSFSLNFLNHPETSMVPKSLKTDDLLVEPDAIQQHYLEENVMLRQELSRLKLLMLRFFEDYDEHEKELLHHVGDVIKVAVSNQLAVHRGQIKLREEAQSIGPDGARGKPLLSESGGLVNARSISQDERTDGSPLSNVDALQMTGKRGHPFDDDDDEVFAAKKKVRNL
ncbi:hypothetical protein CVT26_016211 [Gymnopilus dilepis]|uniref:Zn(2)-C6 fungal-type domain-containing protein n=1 Tax=Gymnopilus dilepis TaxID=231916 RepID=A0A409XZ16_9AGAR|nr:hypothetical protein CVT26_016211 [Gymnopilus dilepis]